MCALVSIFMSILEVNFESMFSQPDSLLTRWLTLEWTIGSKVDFKVNCASTFSQPDSGLTRGLTLDFILTCAPFFDTFALVLICAPSFSYVRTCFDVCALNVT